MRYASKTLQLHIYACMRIRTDGESESRMRKKVSITIDQKIYEKAHKLGLNVSKIAENALLSHIDAIENINQPKQPFSVHAFPQERVEWTGRDLNPRLLDCESSVHTRLNYRPSTCHPTELHAVREFSVFGFFSPVASV